MHWEWLVITLVVFEWVIRVVMVPVILLRRFAPSAALAWLGLIFILPGIGLVLYLFMGVSHLGDDKAASHRETLLAKKPEARRTALQVGRQRPVVDPEQRAMVLQAEVLSGNPIVGGNRVEPVSDGDDLIQRLTTDIASATHHVHLLYYIFVDDPVGRKVGEALIDAVGRGVHCRLLVDGAGSRKFLRSRLYRDLQRAGVEVREALPVAPWRKQLSRIDLRNHRKIAVVDGRVAYMGSHNIVVDDYGHPWVGNWIDLTGRFTGPVVAQIQSVFLDDWAFETNQALDEPEVFPALENQGEVAAQIVPTGPSHQTQTFQRVLIAALSCAQRKIIMTTPYLVLDDSTMLALSMAAERGVEVTLIIPKRSNHPLVAAAGRACIQPLLEAGIEVARYKPGLLHSKTITVDDAFAMLGSANLDIRSFELNFELSALMYGPDVTSRLRFVQQSYLADSEMVDLERWRNRPMLAQLAEQAAALLSPLL